MQVFRYPDNAAYPFGGDGFPEYLVMELHYDNPDMISGFCTTSAFEGWGWGLQGNETTLIIGNTLLCTQLFLLNYRDYGQLWCAIVLHKHSTRA